MLIKAQRLTVGGNSAQAGNQILTNHGYGIYALGMCSGTLVQKNVIVANDQGDVNLTNSRGITYKP